MPKKEKKERNYSMRVTEETHNILKNHSLKTGIKIQNLIEQIVKAWVRSGGEND